MILGLSLDENFIYVSRDGENKVTTYPFAIGKNLSTMTWFIGDEAKNENVDNVDIVVDKLYYIMENDGTAKIGDEVYKAKELVKIFFSNLLSKYNDIEYVSVVVRVNNVKILSKLKYAFKQYFKVEGKFKVSTYSEAFISFLKSKDESYYSDTVSVFNFTGKALTYYEFLRYKDNNNTTIYWKVNTKNFLGLPLDLLSGDAGKKVCDNLLMSFSKDCLKDPRYSHIILSGIGFNESSYYREFMTFVCSLAPVETDIDFFANSAILLSKDLLNNNFDKNIVLLTDARTTASVKLLATVNGVSEKIDLINLGDEWFNIDDYTFDIIVDNEKEITFEILKKIEGVIKNASIAIPEQIKLRDDKTNQIEIKMVYTQQNLLQINLTDKGFGEFFEGSKNTTPKNIEI